MTLCATEKINIPSVTNVPITQVMLINRKYNLSGVRIRDFVLVFFVGMIND